MTKEQAVLAIMGLWQVYDVEEDREEYLYAACKIIDAITEH